MCLKQKKEEEEGRRSNSRRGRGKKRKRKRRKMEAEEAEESVDGHIEKLYHKVKHKVGANPVGKIKITFTLVGFLKLINN